MKAYFIRRLLLVIPTFLGITVMVFAVTRFVPGGPVERMIAEARAQQTGMVSGDQGQPLSEDQIEELKRYYGFDKPLLQSYVSWLGKVVKGDLGTSTRYYDPVLSMILERLPISLYFGLISLVLVYGVCIPLGVAKAVRHNSRFDNISSLLVFTGYAIPGWVIGVLLLLLFASRWEFFPLGGFVGDFYDEFDAWGKTKDVVWHTVLPVISYVAGSFAVMTMLMKNTLMDNLAADYMRTAVAKGLPFRKAVFRHALRNSLIPLATSFGSNISLILTGSFLIEKVFNIDGMGLLGYESVVERDYPVVLGVLVISSLLFLIGNILSDICVALTDPRVTFE
ncbi:ABC transporter permease subunit [Desulfoluna spongiiphila]|uniref:Microcin C transport system permease protein n=1 Tax=Desulfoluna spongiiphila TaxID=419481 RepID=A0A1G5ABP0_9BACT|nr:ABC transporter permease subunit [Desulfoluna spongiiphila]SCX75330.1 microcin C transport system permease protein [Desulfoluna spongiiphila]VVS90741.1 abc transporter type 1 transmembrane domain meti-like [Desulfoluna spongiiphila]